MAGQEEDDSIESACELSSDQALHPRVVSPAWMRRAGLAFPVLSQMVVPWESMGITADLPGSEILAE